MKSRAKITLVGAGPGDPELITVKGLRALQNANVVLYDALANEELLAYASKASVIRFVGKRAGRKGFKQEEIQEQMVNMARMHGHVLRLKGGDPMIFGRGYEELVYAHNHGIPCTVIPGISSAFALTELLNFPLTHRNVSRSILVLTATCQNRTLNKEIIESATTRSTKVILMGISKLGNIVQAYLDHGLSEIPVAVIQNGSKSNEKAVFGTIQNIYQKAINAQIGTPGIIVIGDVVAFHNQTKAHEQKSFIPRIPKSA